VDFFTFVSQQWLLVSTLMVLIYLYTWREKIKSGPPISAHEVTRLLNSDMAVLLDVRDAAEYKAGHIAGAINVPYAKINADVSQLEAHKKKIIIVADKIGQHAGVVGRNLGKNGFVVRRLAGGIAEWQGQSLPLVKT
jgi:rhodanese-related sulfurtransferase